MSSAAELKALAQDAYTSILLLVDSDTSLEELLNRDSDLSQRTSLFFDEILRVVLQLNLPSCSKEQLRSLLEKLDLKVEIWLVSASEMYSRSDNDSRPIQQELLGTETVFDPIKSVVSSRTNQAGEDVLQASWTCQIRLSHFSTSITDPAVILTPIGRIILEQKYQEDMIMPFTTFPSNPFDPANLKPKSIAKLEPLDVVAISSRPVHIQPVIVTKWNFNQVGSKHALRYVVSLSVEIIPLLDLKLIIEEIVCTVAGKNLKCLMPDTFLPLHCHSKDIVNFLYELDLPVLDAQAGPFGGNALPKATIGLVAYPPDGSTARIFTISTCGRDLFSLSNLDQNPSNTTKPLSTAPGSLVRNKTSRTANNVAFGTSVTNRTASTFLPQPATLTTSYHQNPTQVRPNRSMTSCLSITFTAPDTPCKVGEPFSWRLLILNNSPRPVRLVIIPIPRLKHHNAQRNNNVAQAVSRRHAPANSSAQLAPAFEKRLSLAPQPSKHLADNAPSKHKKDATAQRVVAPDIAKAVLSTSALHALYSGSSTTSTPEIDLVTTTTEIRIGPIAVGQAYERDIEFIAFKAGITRCDLVRVVDVSSVDGQGRGGIVHDLRGEELVEVEVLDDT